VRTPSCIAQCIINVRTFPLISPSFPYTHIVPNTDHGTWHTYQAIKHSCMYAGNRIAHKLCHNSLHIISNHDLYDLYLHDLPSSIISRLTQQVHPLTTHSNLRTFLILSHPCPILTLLHMFLTHLTPPLLPFSSHKKKHPHLLTKHATHNTHTATGSYHNASYIAHTVLAVHDIFLIHPTYMSPTLLSIPQLLCSSSLPHLTQQLTHSIAYVYHIHHTHAN
jgi:hypothetical protein